jgi:zinc transport system ATP-binding protein
MARMRGLSVSLNGNEVLRGLDADLRRGSVTALIGYNGAGKTTLLRALLGEVPWTGELRFFCKHDARANVPGHIGYVPQRLRIEGNLPFTVLDLFGLSLSDTPWLLSSARSMRARVSAHLAGVGVPHLIDRFVNEVSGGELQRVLLALALQPTPEILLLDEPAAGIDFHMQEEFYALIGRLNKELGVTVLLVSHDLSMVSRVADHVLCLKDGRIECQGAPSEILAGESLERTFGKQSAIFVHKH